MKHRVPPVLVATIAILGVAATTATAHPGHGLAPAGVGLVHFLLQPSHGGIAAVAAMVLVVAWIVIARRRHG